MDFLNTIDKLQETTIQKASSEIKHIQAYEFDKLRMYFGEDFIYKDIVLSMPTIGEILEIGEKVFFESLSPFLYNSTTIRVMLWDSGVDWNKVKDIEVFSIMCNRIKHKNGLKLIFKNVNIIDYKLASIKNQDTEEASLYLYNPELDSYLSEDDFLVIANYIREFMNMHPKVEKAKGKTAKSWIIQEDKMNMVNEEKKETSTLLPLVSSCVNHPGFKYKLKELKDMGIYQFMDSVKRIQKYESGISALRGCYSGFVDSSKIDKELLNFMGEI